MTKLDKIDSLISLTHAYVLFSTVTNSPYVNEDTDSHHNKAFMYELFEDAKNDAARITNEGISVTPIELKSVQLEDRKISNQVRECLMRLYSANFTAVYYKPANNEGDIIDLDIILPQSVKDIINRDSNELLNLQMSSLYYAQSMRSKNPDSPMLALYSEKFYTELSKSRLLCPVSVPEDFELTPENIGQCKFPTIKQTNQKTKEEGFFVVLFTNQEALQAYCYRMSAKLRIIGLPLEMVLGISNVNGCVIDESTTHITFSKENITKILEISKS